MRGLTTWYIHCHTRISYYCTITCSFICQAVASPLHEGQVLLGQVPGIQQTLYNHILDREYQIYTSINHVWLTILVIWSISSDTGVNPINNICQPIHFLHTSLPSNPIYR